MSKSFLTGSMLCLLACIGTGQIAYAQQATAAAQQVSTVSGTVVDAEGEPVIGAAVKVDGTQKGASTDIDGNFTIPGVPVGSTITVSYVGCEPQSIVWNGGPLSIVLSDNATSLEEVVVVGYGVQKKVNVTGAVSMVDQKAFASRPVQNVSQALQGQVPGLTMSVGNSGGTLDSQLGITIRGNGTIGSGSSGSPLVLIDGIEGNMNTVNPNDIQSVSVLKDAASASIYGARAAFGVILITTKSGSEGKTKVSYQGNVRFSTAIQVPEMLNSEDFANYWNVANINNGGGAVFNEEAMENIRKFRAGQFTDPNTPEYYGTKVNPQNNLYQQYTGSFADTDWFQEFYRKNVPSQEHNLSIAGGTERLNYMISGNFLDQQGLLRHGKDTYQRYTINARIQAKLVDWATLKYTAKWTREDYTRPTYMTGLFFHNIARRWPTCPAYDPHGHLSAEMELIQLEEGGEQWSHKNWYTNQLAFVFEPIKDWHINLEGSMRQYVREGHWAVLPIYGYNADNEPYLISWNGGAAGYSEVEDWTEGQNYYSTNIYTDYSKTIAGNYFKVMVGFNGELYKNRNLYGFGTDLITPTVPELNTVQNNIKAWNDAQELSLAGFFGRLNYNYKERYIFEANIRYDGSSRFLEKHRWAWYPSFSAGWNVAQEEFWKKLDTKVNTLKFRASWGELGNNNLTSYYPFYQAMTTNNANSGWLIDGNKQSTAALPGIVSSTLTWETIRSWDIGLDVAALNNRLTGSFSIFRRDTKGMVADAPPLPGILGASSPRENNANLKSHGWELEIGWNDRIGKVNYSARFVMDDCIEEITEYYNPSGTLNNYYVGRKIGEIWGYTTVGIAQSQAEMDAHLATADQGRLGSNWQAGDIMYKDLNGDGQISNGNNTVEDHGDLSIIGNSTPRYKFGISLSANWNGFDFSCFLQGVGKRDFWVSGPYMFGASGGMWQSAGFKEHLDYWSEDNPGAYYPRPYFGNSKNQNTQTRYLQDASYMRIKNIQFGYTLPYSITKKAGIEQLRVYVSGDNVHTFSKMSKIFDPETLGGDWGNGKLYPLQRVWSIGLNVNF